MRRRHARARASPSRRALRARSQATPPELATLAPGTKYVLYGYNDQFLCVADTTPLTDSAYALNATAFVLAIMASDSNGAPDPVRCPLLSVCHSAVLTHLATRASDARLRRRR